MDEPVYRHMEKRDYVAVKKMINNAWEFDRFSPSSAQREAALDMYLHYCLLEHSYSLVVENGGVPAGFLLGRIEKHYNIGRNIQHGILFFWAFLRYFLRIFRGITFMQQTIQEQKVYRKLIKAAGKRYDGEVVLFIVSSHQQGKGLGKTLINRFLEHCRSKNLNRIYLYTDTECNYGFYDACGFKKAAAFEGTVRTVAGKKPIQYFLYEYDF